MKTKKHVLILITLLCVFVCIFVCKPSLQNRTWVLFYAQKAEPPMLVVAHNDEYDLSNIEDPLFAASKPIELTLNAKGGKLILTDTTNGKTYEGTYKIKSGFLKINQSYSVVIEGIEGSANISSNYGRTLLVSIGDYYLHFEVK